MEAKNKVILVIGPPGVGKGTQSKVLAEKTGRLHISTGDLIREAVRYGTDFGNKAESYVQKGSLVPDDIIIKVILKRLGEQDANHGVILDGFPRTVAQGLAIKAEMEIDRVIFLKASDDECLKRIMARQQDPSENRQADDEKQIRARLAFFNEWAGAIRDLFKDQIQEIDASANVNEVSSSIDRLFLNPLPSLDDNKNIDANLKKPQPEESCVVCMSKPADHLVLPCGHQCGCESCLNEILKRSGGCPICRKPIEGVIRVFRSGVVEEENENKNVVNVKNNNNNNEKKKNVVEENEEVKSLEFDKVTAEHLEISVAPCEDIVHNKKVNVAISLNIPDTPVRRPVDVCCVIDISGSMGEDAKFQDPEDETKTKSDGMSILDLVKHAVKTVIHTLTDQDRLSLVAFDTHARSTFPLTVMNENGRSQAVTALEELVPEESTNIWDGLKTGLDSLRTAKHFKRKIPHQRFLYLLTDGVPNISPASGEDKALKQYFESHSDFTCQVNTFGFGYSLKSSLLLNIGIVGGGMFSFIPDAKIVGTNFVNAIANAVTTLSQNAKVHLVAKGGSTFAGDVGGNLQVEHSGKELIVKLGNLQYGKGRDIVVPMILSSSIQHYLEVTLEYTSLDEIHPHKIKYQASNREKTADAVAAYVRNLVVSESFQVIKDFRDGQTVKAMKSMKALAEKVSAYDVAAENNDARLRGLVSDIVGNGERGGRMSKAITTSERFNRWGQHYLSTISRAHQLQLCTNFMDVGLQVYGGATFSQLQELGGKIFLTLPMTIKKIVPQNANYQNNNMNNYQPAKQIVAPVDNSNYYEGGGGGCFDGSCVVTVLTSWGESVKKRLSDVKKDDFVTVIDSKEMQSFARVICVVQVKLGRPERLIEFPSTGLKITQKHPVWFNNQWRLPRDIELQHKNIACFSDKSSNIVYNFILEHSHILFVNDVRCVTLGHGINEAFHPFYGTSAVIDTIKALEGFDNGLVHVEGSISFLAKSKGLGYIASKTMESSLER